MDDLAEGLAGLLRLIAKVIRVLIWFVWELCIEAACWITGWVVCRILSLGQYPQVHIDEQEKASTFTCIFVPIVGGLSLMGALTFIAKLMGLA